MEAGEECIMTIYSKIKKNITKYGGCVTTLISMLVLFANGVKYGSGLWVRGVLKIYNRGTVILGDNVVINSGLWANPISSATKTCIQVSEGAVLKIGNATGISNTAITCWKEVTIGEHVLIGANCQIFDTDFHPCESYHRFGCKKNNDFIRQEAVVIEDGAFIGSSVIVLKGTRIGKESIIGAGSVVCGNVPPHELWAGVPARFIKQVE